MLRRRIQLALSGLALAALSGCSVYVNGTASNVISSIISAAFAGAVSGVVNSVIPVPG